MVRQGRPDTNGVANMTYQVGRKSMLSSITAAAGWFGVIGHALSLVGITLQYFYAVCIFVFNFAASSHSITGFCLDHMLCFHVLCGTSCVSRTLMSSRFFGEGSLITLIHTVLSPTHGLISAARLTDSGINHGGVPHRCGAT